MASKQLNFALPGSIEAWNVLLDAGQTGRQHGYDGCSHGVVSDADTANGGVETIIVEFDGRDPSDGEIDGRRGHNEGVLRHILEMRIVLATFGCLKRDGCNASAIRRCNCWVDDTTIGPTRWRRRRLCCFGPVV